MRIGLAYNEKPDPANSAAESPSTNDAFAEWDDPSTITAVEQALGLFGSVIRLEADPLFPQKLDLERPDLVFSNILCATAGQLRERVRFLLDRYTEPVLVETYLPGPEFTVAILGNGPAAYCLPVIGLDFSALPPGVPPVYGYEAKWVWDRPEAPLAIFQCPAPGPAGL